MSGTEGYVGTCLGNYRVTAEIGSGGFGKVYRGEHTILTERAVAIKILHAHLSTSEDRERFLQEARLLERLKHPYILHIFDVGIHDGFPYLVAEYAPQGSLRELMKRYAPNPLPATTALNIITQVGQALYCAHQQNIVHRDLKPENILFNAQGNALLSDFGIATTLSTASIKQVNIIGTPSYMAPEQFQSSVSKESDQYALGCIAYELFTGQPPFGTTDFFSMGFNHLTRTPIAPTQLNPDLPPYIEQAILKAMAKQRHDRHADIKAFITALHSSTDTRLQAHIPTQSATLLPDRTTSFIPTLVEQLAQTPIIYSEPVTPLPPVYSEPVTPLPPTMTKVQLPEEKTTLPSPVNSLQSRSIAAGISRQPIEPTYSTIKLTLQETPYDTLLPITGDPGSQDMHILPNTVHPAKHGNSKRRWLLIAVTSLVILASLLATLSRFFFNQGLQSQGNVQTISSSQPLATTTLGSTATIGSSHEPTHTAYNPPAQASTPMPGTTPIATATSIATAIFTPTPTPTSVPTTEMLTLYFINGTNGTSTTYSYKGKVTIHATGAGEEYTNKWLDTFYQYTDANGNAITPVHTSTYPGWTLWINGGVADNYVNPIPSYNSYHDYTFTITAPGGKLTFAIGDTYAKDNSGYLTITVTQD